MNLVKSLVLAIREEQRARAAVRDALRRQTTALLLLKKRGVRSSIVALHLARELGLPMSIAARLRLASRLRKRVSRVTRGHGFDHRAPGGGAQAIPSSGGREANMARIVRRKITEEWTEEAAEGEDLTEGEDSESGDEQEEDQDEAQGETPIPKRRRR